MFSAKQLELDAEAEVLAIAGQMRDLVQRVLKKKGLVLGLSGGVDSSACLALSVAAVGSSRVLALLMPEQDSSPSSLELGRKVAEQLGVAHVVEDLTEPLRAMGCYRRRDEAIRSVLPEYDGSYRQKLVLPQNLLEQDRLNCFSIVVESPSGQQRSARLPLKPYLEIVAATNMKQRARKSLEYYHADRLNYAVVGTPNRLEYDQGFFVKNGDGAADIKPIAHLYKTQVVQLARHLGLPAEIWNAQPSTDTYSLPQTQEEFYFCLPYQQMDLLLFALDHHVAASEAAAAAGLTEEQVRRAYRDIEAKRRTTRYQHLRPLLLGEVPSIAGAEAEPTDGPVKPPAAIEAGSPTYEASLPALQARPE
ncbi:MAG: NAD(+) synthase [Deltaproteobacteria bacterium]|nr:NAD(+) synthase [Deltaproteobacteria bacterium]